MSRHLLVLGAAASAAWALLLVWPGRAAQGPPGSARTPSLDSILNRLRPGPPPAVQELLSGLAAELAAGQPTAHALQSAAVGLEPAPCPLAVAASRTGGDVPEALRADARAPGAQALRGLAACWEVSERSGAGLSVAVSRLAAGLRAGAEADAQLTGEVAAVRTSARLLAALPALGLVIGQWIGAEPLAWLTGSWAGLAVLALGLSLQLAGMAWLHHMVSATRRRL